MPSLSARQLVLLAVFTLLPRMGLAVFLGIVGEPERWEYDVIAGNIVAGSGHVYDRLGFVYAAYSPPLWSVLLAALRGLFGEARGSIQVLQGLLCLGAAVTYGNLARRISGDARTGALAALLVALQPSLLFYSVVKSDPLPLNVLLLGMIVVLGIDVVNEPTPRLAARFGVLLGLGVLSRGTPVVALPIVAVALLGRFAGQALRTLGVIAVAFALCLAPWLIRNVLLLGVPVITTTAGENFWRGNHAGATGGVQDENGGQITHLIVSNPDLPEPIRTGLTGRSEVERDRLFGLEGWRFIREKPKAAMELFTRKLRRFWWQIDSDPRDYLQENAIAYEAVYRLELALAVLGMWLAVRSKPDRADPRERRAAFLSIAVMIAVSLLQCAFYVQGRHRFLIEPLLLLFMAIGLTALVRRGKLTREGTELSPV
ncbi:MAG: glycosyltransferase family 39 protein [Vicinamibacteria bacterium]